MKYGGVAYETDLVYHEKIRDELLQNQVGGRIGFEGVEAESGVAALYLGKRIPQPHWSSQNPVNYTYEIDGMAKGNADSADDSHEPRYERAHDQDAYMSAEDTSQGDDEFAEDSSAQGNPFGNKSNVATPTLPLSELFAGEHDLTFYRLKLRECIEGVNHKRHDSGALFRAATVAINNIDRYNASKRIAQDGVDKLFPPPQLAHDRYYRELSKYDSEFLSHVRKATSIIWIVTEVTGKIDVQLRKSLEAITQISKKLEEFSIEIALKIGNTKDGSVSADIEELVDAMQKLIDSLKEYE
jgi:hypothetical protein